MQPCTLIAVSFPDHRCLPRRGRPESSPVHSRDRHDPSVAEQPVHMAIPVGMQYTHSFLFTLVQHPGSWCMYTHTHTTHTHTHLCWISLAAAMAERGELVSTCRSSTCASGYSASNDPRAASAFSRFRQARQSLIPVPEAGPLCSRSSLRARTRPIPLRGGMEGAEREGRRTAM